MYNQLETYCEKIIHHVKELHSLHINLIKKKFSRSFAELQSNIKLYSVTFKQEKEKWMKNLQESTTEWNEEYLHFSEDAIHWIDQFFVRQKVNLLFLSENNVHKDLYEIINTISSSTEKIKQKVLKKTNEQGQTQPWLDFDSRTKLLHKSDSNSDSKQISNTFFSSKEKENELVCVSLSYIKKLFNYYVKIEGQCASIIEEGRQEYKKLYKKKKKQIKKQEKIVNHFKRSVNCLEENSNFVRKAALEYGQPTIQQVERDILIKNELLKMRPQLQEENSKLLQLVEQYTGLEKMLDHLDTPLPSMEVLQDLQKKEKSLFENRTHMQVEINQKFENLIFKIQQNQSHIFQKFLFYIFENFELAQKERGEFEIQQWNEFEHQTSLIQPELFMLQKNLLQYQEECVQLFEQSTFETLQENILVAWSDFMEKYKMRRFTLQQEHLLEYTNFLNKCLGEINELKEKFFQ